MALEKEDLYKIRLQTLYDVRSAFRGEEHTDVRTNLDNLIREVQADLDNLTEPDRPETSWELKPAG